MVLEHGSCQNTTLVMVRNEFKPGALRVPAVSKENDG